MRYELRDNNAEFVVIDGNQEVASLEIHHDESEGYFMGESFTPFLEFTYGKEALSSLVDTALGELNKERGSPQNDINTLLWDAYMVLDHGDMDERLSMLEQLKQHFSRLNRPR